MGRVGRKGRLAWRMDIGGDFGGEDKRIWLPLL